MLVVPIRANEPNGISVWALLRESVGRDGRLQDGSPSLLFLAQGCLFPFSALGLPFPALPAVASDHGLFIALTAAIKLGPGVSGRGCYSLLQLHLRAEAFGAKLRALVSGQPL